MNDEERLFVSNPLKALFIQNQEIKELLNRIVGELDDEDDYSDENYSKEVGKDNLDGY